MPGCRSGLPTPNSQLPLRSANVYADVILPLALARTYTYAVPEAFVGDLVPGLRVEVQFGRSKFYSGVVLRVHGDDPGYKTKPIDNLIDAEPVVTTRQLALWAWLAEYYACTLGEVMAAGLPSHLKLTSETVVTLGPLFSDDATQLDDQEYLIVEALTIREELSLKDVRDILQKETVYPVIRRLLDRRIVFLREELQDRYRPKMIRCVRFTADYATDEARAAAFDRVARSEKQTAVLLEMIQQTRTREYVRTKDLTQRTGADGSVLAAVAKKGIFEFYEREISRLAGTATVDEAASPLSEQQEVARTRVRGAFAAGKPVLLHGVTGSGKTRVYLDLMQEVIDRGQQALYLLPEIALTGQIVGRLQRFLGSKVVVYHSRLNNMERVEIWRAVLAGEVSVVGPRSALFLPWRDLGLVVVDEEHDASYKQHDPAPRYHGRDAAVYLAHQHGANVILGTATPSLESWENARRGKYELVRMPQRYGGIALPEITVANLRETNDKGVRHEFFTPTLLAAMSETIARGEQVILFQNRRGFAPVYSCQVCDYTSGCVNCDVSLTYHKYQHRLRCHCCGYATAPPETCPACGSPDLKLSGTGTEKIEDELKIFLPDARLARMDADTTRGKNALAGLLSRFGQGELDVLIGTQMVTKGLDFERVGLVGVVNADQLLRFPDFRADERGFQLMTQVAGRAGRRRRRGRVIIQAMETTHPVITDVLAEDFAGFVDREAQRRAAHRFPPYVRMIHVQFRHPRRPVAEEGAKLMGGWLSHHLGEAVDGPFEPSVARLRTYYLQDLVIRVKNDSAYLRRVKELLLRATVKLGQQKGLSGVRVVIDVDP